MSILIFLIHFFIASSVQASLESALDASEDSWEEPPKTRERSLTQEMAVPVYKNPLFVHLKALIRGGVIFRQDVISHDHKRLDENEGARFLRLLFSKSVKHDHPTHILLGPKELEKFDRDQLSLIARGICDIFEDFEDWGNTERQYTKLLKNCHYNIKINHLQKENLEMLFNSTKRMTEKYKRYVCEYQPVFMKYAPLVEKVFKTDLIINPTKEAREISKFLLEQANIRQTKDKQEWTLLEFLRNYSDPQLTPRDTALSNFLIDRYHYYLLKEEVNQSTHPLIAVFRAYKLSQKTSSIFKPAVQDPLAHFLDKYIQKFSQTQLVNPYENLKKRAENIYSLYAKSLTMEQDLYNAVQEKWDEIFNYSNAQPLEIKSSEQSEGERYSKKKVKFQNTKERLKSFFAPKVKGDKGPDLKSLPAIVDTAFLDYGSKKIPHSDPISRKKKGKGNPVALGSAPKNKSENALQRDERAAQNWSSSQSGSSDDGEKKPVVKTTRQEDYGSNRGLSMPEFRHEKSNAKSGSHIVKRRKNTQE